MKHLTEREVMGLRSRKKRKKALNATAVVEQATELVGHAGELVEEYTPKAREAGRKARKRAAEAARAAAAQAATVASEAAAAAEETLDRASEKAHEMAAERSAQKAKKRRRRRRRRLLLLAVLGGGAAAAARWGKQDTPPPSTESTARPDPMATAPVVDDPTDLHPGARHQPDSVSDPETDPLSEGAPVVPDDSPGSFFEQVMAETSETRRRTRGTAKEAAAD